jgi:hypothetical protein
VLFIKSRSRSPVLPAMILPMIDVLFSQYHNATIFNVAIKLRRLLDRI